MSQTSLTVIARVTAKPGDAEALLAALRDDARETLAHEPGCLAFEILLRDGSPGEFVLHEVYADAQAFATHKAQPHFAAFEAAMARHGAGAPDITLLGHMT